MSLPFKIRMLTIKHLDVKQLYLASHSGQLMAATTEGSMLFDIPSTPDEQIQVRSFFLPGPILSFVATPAYTWSDNMFPGYEIFPSTAHFVKLNMGSPPPENSWISRISPWSFPLFS